MTTQYLSEVNPSRKATTPWQRGVFLAITLLTLSLAVPAWASTSLYNQPFDQTGNGLFSQNDTNGFGEYAIAYDNFTLPDNSTVTEARWVGGYYNPPTQGQITGWNISIYDDNAGQPGNLLYSAHVDGTGNETFVGNFAGIPFYSYDVVGLNYKAACSKCADCITDPMCVRHVSFVPDLGYPPQWFWASGTGGDDLAYQDFFGDRSSYDMDLAFELLGEDQGQRPNREA